MRKGKKICKRKQAFLINVKKIYAHVLTYNQNDMNEDEKSIIRKYSKSARYFNHIGPYIPASNAATRYGPFEHLRFMLPLDLAGLEFDNEKIKTLANSICTCLEQVFNEDGRYVLGYHVRPDIQVTNDKAPRLHFHVVLGKLRFRYYERDELKAFFKLHWKQKPHHYRKFFYRAEHIVDIQPDLPRLQKAWKISLLENIPEMTAEMIPSIKSTKRPLVQDDDDRLRCGWYIMNIAAKLWKRIIVQFNERENKALVYVKDAERPKTYTALDFIVRYLFPLMRTFEYRYTPKGYFCGNSKFAHLMNYANKLDNEKSKMEQKFLDQKIECFCQDQDNNSEAI